MANLLQIPHGMHIRVAFNGNGTSRVVVTDRAITFEEKEISYSAHGIFHFKRDGVYYIIAQDLVKRL